MSSGVSDQLRLKLACSATEARMRLEILDTETRDITLSKQQAVNNKGADQTARMIYCFLTAPAQIEFIPIMLE